MKITFSITKCCSAREHPFKLALSHVRLKLSNFTTFDWSFVPRTNSTTIAFIISAGFSPEMSFFNRYAVFLALSFVITAFPECTLEF